MVFNRGIRYQFLKPRPLLYLKLIEWAEFGDECGDGLKPHTMVDTLNLIFASGIKSSGHLAEVCESYKGLVHDDFVGHITPKTIDQIWDALNKTFGHTSLIADHFRHGKGVKRPLAGSIPIAVAAKTAILL